ncbi:Ig-like domain-containing protein [bacterium]|nr:Ig-like domain-containing protein [bacterium]
MVTPREATLNAQSPFGTNAPGYVSTLRLSVDVTFSDATLGHTATWTSSNPARATVASDGTVTVPSTATPGQVTIRAEAGGFFDEALIHVTTVGDVFLIVE